MTSMVGRDVAVEFAIAAEDATPGALVYQTLGMMRGKSMKSSWDTADTTADKSPAYTKTSLVTFKSMEFSGDGVTYTDAVHNQSAFRANAVSPGTPTLNQPKVWLKMTIPGVCVYEGPFIVNEWSDEAPYADAVTWSMSCQSNGDVTCTPL